RAQLLGQRLVLQRLAVVRQRVVFAALAFLEHRVVAVADQRAAHRDPAAVQRAGGAAALVGLAAVLHHIGLQFIGGTLAVRRALREQIAQLGRLHMLGAGGAAVLRVLAGS